MILFEMKNSSTYIPPTETESGKFVPYDWTVSQWTSSNIYISASDSLGFDSENDFSNFNSSYDYADFTSNLISAASSINFTIGFYFKRSQIINPDEVMMSTNSLDISLTNISGQTLARWREYLDDSTIIELDSTTTLDDLNWHYITVSRQGKTFLLTLDGVTESTYIDTNKTSMVNTEGRLGQYRPHAGGGAEFYGDMANGFMANQFFTTAQINDIIGIPYWQLALGPQETDNVFSTGSLYNATTIYWNQDIPNTPYAYTKIYNINPSMDFNTSNGLYHFTYYTNPAEFATSQGTAGANFTTLFSATYTDGVGRTYVGNDTKYWYVKATTPSSCTINSYGWINPSKVGQYQTYEINWSASSYTPLREEGLVVCTNRTDYQDTVCNTYSLEGTIDIPMIQFGNASFYCYSKNDYDIEQIVSPTTTFEVGCWNAYDDYDGTENRLLLATNLHVCSGVQTIIPMNKTALGEDSFGIVMNGHDIKSSPNTIYDGGGVRYGGLNGDENLGWGVLVYGKDTSNYAFSSSNVTLRNGDILYWWDGNVSNVTVFSRYLFNCTIPVDIEPTAGGVINIINNTFDTYGIKTTYNGWQPAIYVSGTNPVNIIANHFINPADGPRGPIRGYGNSTNEVQCKGECTNLNLEQNYYWDIDMQRIYTRGNSRTVSTDYGNFTCMIGEVGKDYPYSSNKTTELWSDIGYIQDLYPCTTKTETNPPVMSYIADSSTNLDSSIIDLYITENETFVDTVIFTFNGVDNVVVANGVPVMNYTVLNDTTNLFVYNASLPTLSNYTYYTWANDSLNNYITTPMQVIEKTEVTTTTTTTTSTTSSSTSTSSTTSTTLPCVMQGNYPDCSEVTLIEAIDAINLWEAGEMDLFRVVDLINSWADPSQFVPS